MGLTGKGGKIKARREGKKCGLGEGGVRELDRPAYTLLSRKVWHQENEEECAK